MTSHEDRSARHRRPPDPRGPDSRGPDAERDHVDSLLTASGLGDLSAFGDLYDHTSAAVFGLLKRVLRGPGAAEEATQRVYVHAWRTAPSFDPTQRSARSLLMLGARRELADGVFDIIVQGRRAARSGEIPDPTPLPS